MSLPADWATVRVTARYLLRDGSVPSGTVTFSSPQIVLVDGTIVLPADLVATLDGEGAIAIDLPATNDPDVTPAGWAYTVTERIEGCSGRRFAIAVDVAGGDIDLATATPVVPAAVMGAFPMLLKGASYIDVVDQLPAAPDPNAVYITTT